MTDLAATSIPFSDVYGAYAVTKLTDTVFNKSLGCIPWSFFNLQLNNLHF